MRSILLLIVGFVLIVFAANYLVSSASRLAHRLGVSTGLIGLTIIALGTSAPEIVVSLTSAMNGKAGVGIGNAIGSNIANIGLVLGLTALISPLRLQPSQLKRELPLLFIVMICTYGLLIDNTLGRLDSVILLTLLCLFLSFMAVTAKQPQNQVPTETALIPVRWPILILIASLIALQFGAKIIVIAAVNIAKHCGLSEWIIGLTIVAIGTSLPEVITSIVGALKGEDDLAFGNVIGSNIFNLLAVLPISGIVQPTTLSTGLPHLDLPFMFVLTLLMVLFCLGNNNQLSRLGGGILVMLYMAYLVVLLETAV